MKNHIQNIYVLNNYSGQRKHRPFAHEILRGVSFSLDDLDSKGTLDLAFMRVFPECRLCVYLHATAKAAPKASSHMETNEALSSDPITCPSNGASLVIEPVRIL